MRRKRGVAQRLAACFLVVDGDGGGVGTPVMPMSQLQAIMASTHSLIGLSIVACGSLVRLVYQASKGV